MKQWGIVQSVGSAGRLSAGSKKSGVSSADYARYTLDAFDGDRSPAAKLMKEMARRYLQEHIKGGPGFGVFGKSGMGKTHICIAVCHGLTVDKYEPHYYFSYRTEIPNLVKAARNYAEDYERAIHKWKTCQTNSFDDLFKLSGKVQKRASCGRRQRRAADYL